MHYIFEIHIRPGYSADEYAQGWLAASEIIQRSPGALGTRLHRKIGDDNVLLAIATWQSKEQRDAMEGDPSAEVQAIIASQLPFIEVHFIGEYEAPEWAVVPEGVESPPGWG
ncbi:MAG: antibiotic biosynthesis monooxygenase [Halioglobus sp.]|nr:antibiotic biosynthesis monooxygenase [Halioglobus sp.]